MKGNDYIPLLNDSTNKIKEIEKNRNDKGKEEG
jgi:hypothetical protein